MARSNRLFSTALGALVALSIPCAAFAADDATMDHSGMASQYQAEANAAQEKVKEHEDMIKRYKSMSTPKGSPMTKEQMVQHCQNLVKAYKEASAEASTLAKDHAAAAHSAH
ncbi:MAG TPA: hypothetical protein VFD92_19950 [Candidatus Binatia bacterium]|nr:hypothetical protein [Candidatus Binatia bacterium]